MYVKIEPFGWCVYGELIGSTWLSLVEIILKNGELTLDEGRKRLCLQNIRVKSSTQLVPDPILQKYGDKKNIDEIVHLTFDNEIMHDFDVVPSFSPGSQSYYGRIKGWKMLDFVVKRLAEIPESKKGVMSFIRQEDYKRTLENPRDDYLPCITSIQFRLIQIDKKKGYHLNTIFNARSIDAFQKASGNFTAIAMLSKVVAERLAKKLKVPVYISSLDGMITDAHIYQETLEDAKEVLQAYKKYDRNNG